jgi:hypothetical protein
MATLNDDVGAADASLADDENVTVFHERQVSTFTNFFRRLRRQSPARVERLMVHTLSDRGKHFYVFNH